MIGRVGSREIGTIKRSTLRRGNFRIDIQFGKRSISLPLKPEYVPTEVIAVRSVGVNIIPGEAERFPELRACSFGHPHVIQLSRSHFDIEELISVVGAVVAVNILVIKRRAGMVEKQGARTAA